MNLTIISGSARENSRTFAVARRYFEVSLEAGFSSRLLDLRDFPVSLLAEMAQGIRRPEHPVSRDLGLSNSLLAFVVPEYNGSFPGMLKLFIDAVPQQLWKGKKAALLGLSSGRTGNIRGLEHLASVLNYLDITVLPKRINIDQVAGFVQEGNFVSESFEQRMRQQILLLKDF